MTSSVGKSFSLYIHLAHPVVSMFESFPPVSINVFNSLTNSSDFIFSSLYSIIAVLPDELVLPCKLKQFLTLFILPTTIFVQFPMLIVLNNLIVSLV
mgnify:CR=1 FL=1